jgi:hypothetical protein
MFSSSKYEQNKQPKFKIKKIKKYFLFSFFMTDLGAFIVFTSALLAMQTLSFLVNSFAELKNFSFYLLNYLPCTNVIIRANPTQES